MSTQPRPAFVLIHGGWHGGWCWQRLVTALQDQGHVAYAPTLAGLGDKAHLLSPEINLSTHIREVADLILGEDLTNVVLVGHSYGGIVISGVAELVRKRLATLVFLDAFVPSDGDSAASLTTAAGRDAMLAAQQRGDIAINPVPAAFFKVRKAADAAWIDSLCTPHPIATMLEPVRLSGAREGIANKVFIRATQYPSPIFDATMKQLEGDPGWRIHLIDTGHDAMIDDPVGLARVLVNLA